MELRVKRKILLTLELDESSQFICLAKNELGLSVHASTREKLFEEINIQIAVLWQQYALASDDDLTDSARNLKMNLKSAFEERRNAA